MDGFDKVMYLLVHLYQSLNLSCLVSSDIQLDPIQKTNTGLDNKLVKDTNEFILKLQDGQEPLSKNARKAQTKAIEGFVYKI